MREKEDNRTWLLIYSGAFGRKSPRFGHKSCGVFDKAVDFSAEDANNALGIHHGAEPPVQLCPNSAERMSAVGHFAEKSGEFIDEGAIRRP